MEWNLSDGNVSGGAEIIKSQMLSFSTETVIMREHYISLDNLATKRNLLLFADLDTKEPDTVGIRSR